MDFAELAGNWQIIRLGGIILASWAVVNFWNTRFARSDLPDSLGVRRIH